MKILLLGANGQLGKELERQLSSVGSVAAFPRSALYITNLKAVADAVRAFQPNIIVNAAAYTAVDKAKTDAEFAHAVNADAVANLAQIEQEQSLWLFHYSTDYVFDGSKQSAYLETDTPNPINVYGASKLVGETATAAADCQHLIFRTTWVIGKDGHKLAKTLIAYAEQQLVPLKAHAADIQAIMTAECRTAAKRPLNSQLATDKFRSQLSFDLSHLKDDFLDVASGMIEKLKAA